MRRYTHGHSLALGVLLCLLVQRNGWLVLVCVLLVFCAGVTVGRTWAALRRAPGLLWAWLQRPRADGTVRW